MDKLTNARKEINEIDSKIAELFEKRMHAASEIAEYKKSHGMPIFDESREALLIKENIKHISDDMLHPYYINFLKSVMNISKQYQNLLINGMKVAFCGVSGAFSDIAAKRIFPYAEFIGFETFQDAYNSVLEGICDSAVLPIENSSAGIVGEVSDLMFDGELFVNGIYTMPIVHNLLAKKGANLDTIKTVISHPQALSQCSKYIEKHGFDKIKELNTAVSAKIVSEKNDITIAAIASEETASLYNLKIIDHDINSSSANTTKFAVFSNKENHDIDSNKFILMFTANDVPGSLSKAINIISENGFNMKVLNSRKVKDKDWQYYFYTEIVGSNDSELGKKMISELSKECSKLKVVGHFKKDISLKDGKLL